MVDIVDEIPDIEYSIVTEDDDYFNHASNSVGVIGKMKRDIHYNLKQLMESNATKHKEIVKSLVINTVEKNSSDGFKCLLYKNYQISPLNDKNQTALHLAYYENSRYVISEFEDYLKSEYCQESNQSDCTDANGLTHLHVACAWASIKLIDTFCKNNDNINTRFVISTGLQKDCSGFTPLHFAAINFKYHNKEMMEMLIERGADVHAVDDMGRTPLHLISSLSYTELFGEKSLEAMKALIDHQADVNAKDAEGITPLFICLLLDNSYIFLTNNEKFTKLNTKTELKLKLLLERGADVNVKNNNNDTVLHCAVNYFKIIRVNFRNTDFEPDDLKVIQLIELVMKNQEIDVNSKNNNGETPLLLAISYLSVVMVKFFLKHKADLTNLTFDRKTDKFFNYTYGTLTLKPLQKLIEILKLLWNEGCILKPKDNLKVLKFLVHEGKICHGLADYHFESETFHMMCNEPSENLAECLRGFVMDVKYDRVGYGESSEEYLDYFDSLRTYLACINYADVFMHEHSKTLIKDTLNTCKKVMNYGYLDFNYEELDAALNILESTELSNGQFLIDILSDRPERAAKYFGNNDINDNWFNNLGDFEGIVKGHLTMSVIRYYVVKLAYNCTAKLHCTPLPLICYELLADYLSNKDILNLCLALDI